MKTYKNLNFWIDLMGRRLQLSILITLPKTFSASTVIVRSKFWRSWKKENFQKLDFLIDLLRRRLQLSILISLPKSFSPSTVFVRSKFWRICKKRTFKRLFFHWFSETKTAIFNFDIPAEIFLANTVNLRSKVRRVWKKQNFQKVFFYSKSSFGHVECSFKKQVENFPPRSKKSFSSSYVTSNSNISKRIHIDT